MYENNMSPADMAAVMGNHGFNNGSGFGDNAWWLIIIFLFAMNNGGWGNGFGGGNGMMPWMLGSQQNSDVQRGFDQAALTNAVGNVQNAVTSGFGDVQTALCGGFAGVNSTVANGFAQAEIANNARQIADMNQAFAMQTGLSNQLNTIAMNQQNCCCENRAAVADLKYTVANEACADRAAVNGALRDVTAQGVANTQAMLNAVNAGIQSIKDQLCNDKIDAKNEKITELERQLTMANLAASQAAQTAAIEQYILPNARPAYLVQNPYTAYNPYGCGGCGCSAA